MFLEISQISQENTCGRASFLTKMQALGLSVFFWDKGIFDFFARRATLYLWLFLTYVHIYRKCYISMRFLIKIIFFHLPPKEKISYFLEKKSNAIFPDITKKIIFKRNFLERPSLQNIWKKKIRFFVQFYFVLHTLKKTMSLPE